MATNPHTGDKLQTKPGNSNFVEGFGGAFTKEYAVGYTFENSEKELTLFAESVPHARRLGNDILKKHMDAFITYVRVKN